MATSSISKKPPMVAQLVDLSQSGVNQARFARFSRLGNFLVTVSPDGAGQLFKLFGMFGDRPKVEPAPIPEAGGWQDVVFRPEILETERKRACFPELFVCRGDEIVHFAQKSMLDKWAVLGRISIPNVRTLAFSPDGQLLAAGCKDGRIKVWAACGQKPEEIWSGQTGSGCITEIAFSRANDVLYYTTAGGNCFQHSGGDSAPTPLKAPDERSYGLPCDWECHSLACHPTGPQVLLGGSGSIAWWMSMDSEDPIVPLHTKQSVFISKVCFLSAGTFAVLGSQGVELWNSIARRRTTFLPVPEGKRVLAVRQFVNTCYIVVS